MEPLNFKQLVQRDIHNIFLNTDEFAERRTLIYDKEEYPDLSVVLQDPALERRDSDVRDHVQGLHMATLVLYCAREDLGGKLPETNKTLEISPGEGERLFRKYRIASATDQMGMLRIELEATR